MANQDLSIYLLCAGFDSQNSLEKKSKMKRERDADNLPLNSVLYLHDGVPYTPWWRDYFGVKRKIKQSSKGAILFLPVDDRWLALCFGHVASNLRDDSFEYDFGLRTTLNCVDPARLRNTDTAEPGAARRRRTQLTVGSDLTLFDFDRDSAVLRSLTGKVKDEFSDIIGQATGATNLRIRTGVSSGDLEKLGRRLIAIYKLEDFRTTFADIQNVIPVRDPATLGLLGQQLLVELRARSENLLLAIPEIVDYSSGFFASFSGCGPSKEYDDVLIETYFEYLDDNQIDYASLTVDGLKRQHLQMVDEDKKVRHAYSILRALLCDVELPGEEGVVYHLSEGRWYRVDEKYLQVLTSYLDHRHEDPQLPACGTKTEGPYNEALGGTKVEMTCLDCTDVSPSSQTQVEPCDIYMVRDGRARLIHVKISTDAPALSHLFNQGSNAVELLKSDPQARSKLKDLLAGKNPPELVDDLQLPVDEESFEVTYAIITHKPPARMSMNLPLFSRISLRRNLKSLELMGVRVSFGFIEDSFHRGGGRRKVRKRRGSQKKS